MEQKWEEIWGIRARELFLSFGDPLFIVEDGVILDCNPKAAQLFGTSRQEMKGLKYYQLCSQGEWAREIFEPRFQKALERGEERFQTTLHKKEGEEFFAEITIQPIPREEESPLFLVHTRDITQEKRLETQLQEIHKMEALGTLVGGIAHQFNNILTGIIGYAELASIKVASDDPVIKDLENIKEGARKAAELVRKLAAFGRKAILKLQKTHINRLVVEQVPLVESILPQDIKLKIRIDPHMEAVEVDPEAIKDILFNLCKNAVEAMPQGGTLTLETRTYTVDQELVRKYPWLEEGIYGALIVKDTGRGIEEKVMPHIFEPFFTTKEVGEGTGLGLSMVYGLVKQHRGAILVKSQPGKGSAFTVLFPVAKAPDLLEERRESYLPFQPGMGKRLVLLVEDEEPVRKVIRETLEGGGCEVLEASSGKEAMKILRQTHREIDLAILDLILPGMNGKKVGQKVQELFPQTRILFISGYSKENLHPKHRPEEGHAFIQKPFTPTELLKKVGELMK